MLAEATATAQTTRSEVLAALHQASVATGSNFSYLLGTAMRESSLKPSAKSDTSSAAGLFQFVGQTWLGMVKQFGAKYGLGSYAGAIEKGADGHYRAATSADRQAILALRNDPRVSALMAGEYANQTKSQLESRLGRDVCDGELYAAHFLGPGAACHLIALNQSNPGTSAASAFPAAAEANRSVFYHSDGTAKTVKEVYSWALKQPASATPPAGASSATSAPLLADAELPATAPAGAPFAAGVSDWSTLSLFLGASGATSPLGQMATLAQAPFVLTPGVVSLLASLTPDGSSPDSENRNNG